MHIVNNVVMQLLLGILLEMVHKWWRVLVIYFAGVLAGSLATSSKSSIGKSESLQKRVACHMPVFFKYLFA